METATQELRTVTSDKGPRARITFGQVDPASRRPYLRNGSNGVVAPVTTPVAALTPAMLRLQEMRARQAATAAPRIEAREYQGESWFFLRLDYPSLSMARHDVARATGQGAIAWVRGATKAAILYCVCQGPNDPTPYFTDEDLTAWLAEPAGGEFWGLIKWLELQALDLNPDIYPKAEAAAASPPTSPSTTSPPGQAEADGSETPTTASAD